eukprot:3728385-Amphidinium_carterae.1
MTSYLDIESGMILVQGARVLGSSLSVCYLRIRLQPKLQLNIHTKIIEIKAAQRASSACNTFMGDPLFLGGHTTAAYARNVSCEWITIAHSQGRPICNG